MCSFVVSLFYIYHKFIFSNWFITLFEYSLPYSGWTCPYCRRYNITLFQSSLFVHFPNEPTQKWDILYHRSVTSYVIIVFTAHLPLFCSIHHKITMPFVLNNTLFCYVNGNRYSVAIIKHKCEYHCTMYFNITVVNIVSCIAVPFCCFIIWFLSQVYLLHQNH